VRRGEESSFLGRERELEEITIGFSSCLLFSFVLAPFSHYLDDKNPVPGAFTFFSKNTQKWTFSRLL